MFKVNESYKMADDSPAVESDEVKAIIQEKVEARAEAMESGDQERFGELNDELAREYRVVVDDYFKYWHVLHDYKNDERFKNNDDADAIDTEAEEVAQEDP